MRLSDILSQAGTADPRPAPTKPVKFRVLGSDLNGQSIAVDAEAVLAFVDEHARAEAKRDARRACKVIYGEDPIPPDALSDEITIHILLRALRNVDDPRQQFASTAQELRKALTVTTRDELVEDFNAFLSAEFPPWVEPEEFEELVKEAAGKSLAALLSSGGSSTKREKLIRALPSLLVRFAK